MLKSLASAIAVTALTFSPLTANAQGKATKYVQPFQCTNGAIDTSSSSFINASGRFPLRVVTDGTNGRFDNLGAAIVVPADTLAQTVSFQVIPNETLPFLHIAVLGTWALNGNTGAFNSGDVPNNITGNQAKNKNLQYTFNLQNFVNGFGTAPAGSTITSLFVDVEVLHSAGDKSGSVLLDNFTVNGELIPVKVPQNAGCTLPFER